MVTFLLSRCGVPPTGCCPSLTDPVWTSHRQQLSKYYSNMAPYHHAHPSGTAPHGSPSPSAPLRDAPHRLQLRPGAATVGVSMGCGLQVSSTAAPQAPPWLHVDICSVGCPWAAGISLLLHGSFLGCKDLLLCAGVPPAFLPVHERQKKKPRHFSLLGQLQRARNVEGEVWLGIVFVVLKH